MHEEERRRQGRVPLLLLVYRHVMANCSVKMSPHGDLHDEPEGSTRAGLVHAALVGRITNQQGATALRPSVR
jgi:hypothetical protein